MSIKACQHKYKTCIKMHWATAHGDIRTPDDAVIRGHNAHVDLWYCKDTEHFVYHDWHTDTWTVVAEGSEFDARLRKEFL